MTQGEIIGLVALLCISVFSVGFMAGYCANPDDTHD